MKWLCFLLALLWVFPAQGEYEGWQLTAPDTDTALVLSVYPLDERNAAVFSSPVDPGKTPCHWSWYQEGRLLRDLAFYREGNLAHLGGASMLMTAPDTCRAVVSWGEGAGENTVYRCAAYAWTDQGLENPMELYTGLRQHFVCGQHLLTAEKNAQGQTLTLMDVERGDTLWQGTLPVSADFALNGAVPLGADAILIYGKAPKGNTVAFCVDAGAVRWQRELNVHHFPPMADGQGGFFLVDDPNRGDYSDVTVYHYDPQGRQDGAKRLTGNTVVKRISDGKNGVLCGTAVANSRRVYTVFSLAVDPQLKELGLDVRALGSAYRDYIPRVYMAPNGARWVFTSDMTRGTLYHSPALIPFDALPAASNPGLTLE